MFVRHSGGFEREDKDAVFENRAFDAFENAFNAEYQGKRTPLQLGFHFTLMNGGAYWRALERFAADVCQKPGVACVSYRDYIARNAPLNAGRHGQRRRLISSASDRFDRVGLLPLHEALVDIRQRRAFERRLERAQALVDGDQLHDRRPGIDQILERAGDLRERRRRSAGRGRA